MCIRDRARTRPALARADALAREIETFNDGARRAFTQLGACLLYTSDAADERSSVDLGGRRIIKKKKSDDVMYRIATAYIVQDFMIET